MELDSISMDSPALEALINTQIFAGDQRIKKLRSCLSNQVNTATLKKRHTNTPSNTRTGKQMGKPKSNGLKADAPVKDTNKNKRMNGNNRKTKKQMNSNRRVSSHS
jgi:hypothetical protein